MKAFSLFVKYVIVPVSTVGGIFFGVDKYIIERAHTVVEPTKIKLEYVEKNHRAEIKNINDKFETLIQQNSVMYQEMLKRNNP